MAGQGSARVTLREIDLSQVRNPQQQPQGVPAAVVGPASKGPAFVPRTFANMQQFEEVFGSMRERGYQGNANLFGPMALNEWMRSASAGTYLRVLGVGDGLKSSGGKTTDAGFVVGAKQVQEQSNDLGKVGDNPHATIEDSNDALALGRTQFLGCFMKDSTGSNFLKDAGMEAEGSAASLVIEFGALPQSGDTIKLDAVDEQGNLNGDVTFTFGNGGVAIGASAVEALANLKAAIEADGQLGDNGDHRIDVSAVDDVNGLADDNLARITLTSAFPVALDSTNDCIAKFNLNPAGEGSDLLIKVGDKTASVKDDTFSFAQVGGTAAFADIVLSDQPAAGGTLSITAITNDGDGTFSDQDVVYTFKANLANPDDAAELASGQQVSGVYRIASNTSVEVKIGNTFADTSSNLRAAFRRVASQVGDGISTSTKHEGLFVVGDLDTTSFRLTHVLKGEASRSKNDGETAPISVDATNLTVKGASDINNTLDDTIINDDTDGFFKSGSDGSATTLTMKLSDNPNSGDNLELQMVAADGSIKKDSFEFATPNVYLNGNVIVASSIAATAELVYTGKPLDTETLTLTDANDDSLVFEIDEATDDVAGGIMRSRLPAALGDALADSGADIGQTITLEDTAGTSETYILTDTGAGGLATGAVVALNNDLGDGNLAVQGQVGHIAVGVDLTNDISKLVLIRALADAIASAEGHGNTITIEETDVDGQGGNDSITIFQSVGDAAGNTAVTTDIAPIVAINNTSLTRGIDRIAVGIKSAADANAAAGSLVSAINNSALRITATRVGNASPVTLTQDDVGTLGNDKDIAETLTNYTADATFAGGVDVIAIELGVDKQETLYNMRRALSANTTAFSQTLLSSAVSDSADSITISMLQEKGSLKSALTNVINVSDAALFSNPAGEIKLGNFGEKQENFSGGGGAATPVIRGVLMTPQGVKAAMDVAAGLDDLVNSVEGSAHIRSVAHGKTFGVTAGTNLTGYTIGEVSETQGFKIILNGYSNTQNPAVLNCSFNPDSPSYFAKVLNTDSTKIEELGHYLYAWWDVKPAVASPSNVGLRHSGGQLSAEYERMIGFLTEGASGRDGSLDGSKPNYENFESKFRTSCTPWIVSQFYGSEGDQAVRPATAKSGDSLRLFKLHSLDDGSASNNKFRLLISNLRYVSDTEYGSFDMTLESWDSDPIKGTPLAAWKNASLDPMSNNFVGRLVGDKHIYFDFEKDADKQRLREEGQYAQKNPYVRIELSDGLKKGNIPVDALPTGFQGHSILFTNTSGNFIEPTDLVESKRIFTDAADNVSSVLSTMQVLPMDYVISINRQPIQDIFEADDDLAWGVKFGLRESQVDFISDSNRGHKENQEQVFNKSMLSWAKFFPDFGSNPAMLTDGDDTDLAQNSFFSLEKIEIPSSSLTSDKITSWDGSMYRRNAGAAPSNGSRFVNISKDANVKNLRYLKFRCMFQGGFDGVNIFDEQKAEFSGTATLREGFDETDSKKFTGPTIMSYRRAVDVLSDKSAAEFQLLVLPGQRASAITDYAISACEDRFDALYLMDIVEKNDSDIAIEDAQEKANVRNTIREFSQRLLDTSFAAAYFPDVLMRRPSDNAPTLVPPSVGMLGALSRNDSIADPWFAPAGLNRGRLNAIDSKVQMTRDLLDELYDADINPIYVPAGRSGEVYAFGQKTLLQDQSALDRINVRRLLIDIRRKVRKVGEQLLFEPNRASTLSRFSGLVEPIMANVQARRGVARYKVQIDASTTTQADVENNTIRGKIYLQPLKSVEFISLDFVVANNIE